MTSGTAQRRREEARARLEDLRRAEDERSRKRRMAGIVAWSLGLLVLAGIVTAALLSSRPVVNDVATAATPFTLPTSDGGSVSLSDFAGKPVLLYFSEGAGCDACIQQIAAIEDEPGFAEAGVSVLPIVMNTPEQINADAARFSVDTPFAIDDGTVSQAYGTLGTGMHAGLPGHGFVLIDADGVQQWSGDYPSMWIDPAELLGIVRGHL